MSYVSRNPATGVVLAEYPTLEDDALVEKIDQSGTAFTAWRHYPVSERVRVLHLVADLFRDSRLELAELVTSEMGKPISQAAGEVDLAHDIYRYYADHAEELLAPQRYSSSLGGQATIALEPTGSILGIMPWNLPYYQVARFAAPNLLLGNTVLLKHAPNVPLAALKQEQLITSTGIPEGVYINLFASNDQVADIVIPASVVSGVSLTGSERAGSAVASTAGRNLKKVVLELGGSDPFIVLDGVDLDGTVDAAVTGRVQNAGQTCTASKRFVVLDDVYDEFIHAFIERMSAIEPGDPSLPETRMGPLSSEDALRGVLDQVETAIAEGAVLRVGGSRLPRAGAFMEPTVLTDVTPQMRAFSEEIFGPVAVVYRAKNVDDAIEIANSSPFGLSGAVFGGDPDETSQVASRLESGMVFINSLSRTAPDLPFGGVKRSGTGRELGRVGLEEFANRKLIHRPKE